MFLLIDTADLNEIRRAEEYLPLAGVTTCPTIIVKERRPFWSILRDIRAIIGEEKMLHAQVMGRTSEEIVKDAIALHKQVSGNFYVKVPVSLEGFRAMAQLHKMGIPFTATTVHSVSQAMLAADAGASFIAPYINHIEDAGIAGSSFISQAAKYLNDSASGAKLLAASFRNVRQITEVVSAGAHTVTVSPDLIWKLAENSMTDGSVAKFRNAWNGFYGEDKCIFNLD